MTERNSTMEERSLKREGRARQELRLDEMPELLRGAPIFPEEVGKIYVLNIEKTGGDMMTGNIFVDLDPITIGGWYEITKADVNQQPMATADD